jgi:MFS family permease
MIVGNAIGEAANTYSMLLAARIVQGFATSAFESLIVAAVGDVFYVHERGLRVSAITFILNASSSLASIICGQITAGLGWNWLFHFLQIFTIIQVVLMFLFCPESAYIRDHAYDIDQVTDDKLEQLAETEHKRAGVTTEGESEAVVEQTRVIPIKKTFTQNLSVFTGTYSKESVIKQLSGPFVTLLNVGAAWSTVTSGLLTMWYVTSAIIQAGLFSGPPWDFTAAQVGYLSAGPFIGGLIGSAIMVFTSDPAAKWLTKRNKGIYEPEFRLWHMIGAVIGCGIGMFGYGHFIQIGGNAYVVAVFQGIMMVGVLIGTIAPVSYALDAYRDASNEIFIMNMLMKNFLFFGISYVANDWVVNDGAFDVLAVCASTSMFIVIPLKPPNTLPTFSLHAFFRDWSLILIVYPCYSNLHLRQEIAQLLVASQSPPKMGIAIERSDGDGCLNLIGMSSKNDFVFNLMFEFPFVDM